MRILITGASGFIGQHLTRHLVSFDHQVTALVRSVPGSLTNEGHPDMGIRNLREIKPSNTLSLADISDITAAHLKGIEMVIHLAGVTHKPGSDKSEYYRVNVEGTRHLLDSCVEAGVKRIIYLSSVKAIAERSILPLKTNVTPIPEDDYGKTKLAAERLLVASNEIETVILRVPLVYGKGVKGNFASLVKLVGSGTPLPFVSVHNRRSYLGIQNLCDFFSHCIAMESLPTHIFHVSDGPSVSLAGLVRCLYEAMGNPPRSFWVPELVFDLLGSRLLGRTRAAKLFGDLELDMLATRRHTGWTPRYSMQQGLAEMFPPGS
tara:strand:- start:4530 stop:5486 length:957 start_codon:yes stop_codon:yes gene_type:complete